MTINKLYSILLSVIMLMSFNSMAYDFTVSGTVTDSLDNPISNQAIMIIVDEDTTVIYTSGGQYYQQFELNDNVSTAITVSTYSTVCNQYYSQSLVVESAGRAIFDFQLCVENNNEPDCELFFYYMNQPGNQLAIDFEPVLFNFAETTFAWNFGDGTTSSDSLPTHVYAEVGEYTVSLSTNSATCGELNYETKVYLFNDTINLDRCYADFYYLFDTLTAAELRTVNFIDNSYSSGGIVSWEWNFGDDETSSNQYPVHEYAQAGEYIVTLNIEGTDGCTSSFEEYIWVGENQWYPEDCQAVFFTNYSSDNYLNVNFENLSWGGNNAEILAYQWTFGDGNGSAQQNPEHTYSQDGEYTVTLTIYTDSCSSVFQETLYIEDWGTISDCQAFFYTEFDSTAVAIQFYDLSRPSASFWNWNFGDGESSSEQNPYHLYSGVGTYTVTLTAGTNDCEATYEMELEIYENSDTKKSGSKGVTYSGRIIKAYAVHSSTPTAIETNNGEDIFNMYPNPINNVLIINFNENVKANIQIITITGQVIKSIETNVKTNVIDTQDLTNGIYFAKVTINGQVYTKKIIK